MVYFSYDPLESGVTFHQTEEKAREFAEGAFEECRDIAISDGWGDHAKDICWGTVSETAEEIETRLNGAKKESYE